MLPLILSFLLAAPPLAGSWSLDGATYVVLRPNGTGTSKDVGQFSWTARGSVITVVTPQGVSQIPFRLSRNQLTIVVNGRQLVLRRGAGGTPAGVVPAGAVATSTPLARLLLSSVWCTFRFNKVTGYSSSSRIAFRSNGTWDRGARSEGFSSGHGGSMASQGDSRSGGRWQVRGSRLFIAQGAGPLAEVRLVVKRNSAGHPIVVADGVEYSQCR